MKNLFLSIALFATSGFNLALNAQSTNLDSLFSIYKALNDSETRLDEFKDSDHDLKLKIIQLGVINESRTKHKRQPVMLDILASRVANKMCLEAAEHKYVGHWNMAGEKPYHRYAFAGGVDHVAENASGMWMKRGVFDWHDSSKLDKMQRLHALFMAEKAPHDGHKKNCLDKYHNYVGIGFFMDDIQARYYEEFIDRYFTFDGIPEVVNTHQSFTIAVTVEQDKYLSLLAISRLKSIKPMRVNAIKRRKHYNDFDKKYKYFYPWDLATVRDGRTYQIELSFPKPGVYYLLMVEDKKELTKPANYSSKGKLIGSSIVIRVLP